MFKLNESVYDEVVDQLEKNINKFASDNATKNEQKLVEALELLNKSAESLEQFGLIKEAKIITKLIVVASKEKFIKEHKYDNLFELEVVKSNILKNISKIENTLSGKSHIDKVNNVFNGVLLKKHLESLNEQKELIEILIKECEIKNNIYASVKKKKAPKKSKKDPHTDGLTSEKMLHNLATKGIEFNADDENMAKDHKLKSFPESLHGVPVIYLEKGDEDYNAYCPKCAKELQDEGKNIHGHIYEEGPNRECNKCGTQLESAMGQDAYYKENADEIDNQNHSHEGQDEYKREQLENGMDEYDGIMNDLDEHNSEDQVFI